MNVFINVFKDKANMVCLYAVEGLGKLRDKQAIEPNTDVLTRRDDRVHDAANVSLMAIEID